MTLRTLALPSLLAILVASAPAYAAPRARGHGKAKAATTDKAAPKKAIEDFKAGQEAFARGDYRAAAIAWSSAYTFIKDPILLFNIGQAYEKAGDLASAATFYQRYIDSTPPPSDAPQVRAHLAALQAASAPALATTATAPSSSSLFASGRPSTMAAATAPASRPLAALPPVSVPLPPPAPPPPAPQRDMLARVAWGGAVITSLLLVTGVGFGLEAESKASDIQRLEQSRMQTTGAPFDYSQVSAEYNGDQSRGQTYSSVATALFVSSAVTAVLTAGAFLLDSHSSSEATTADGSSGGTGMSVAPVVGPGYSGLSAVGRF